jgi:hypothetical protein
LTPAPGCSILSIPKNIEFKKNRSMRIVIRARNCGQFRFSGKLGAGPPGNCSWIHPHISKPHCTQAKTRGPSYSPFRDHAGHRKLVLRHSPHWRLVDLLYVSNRRDSSNKNESINSTTHDWCLMAYPCGIVSHLSEASKAHQTLDNTKLSRAYLMLRLPRATKFMTIIGY